jgi:S-DNA-T family DNA segregation ATPase FtsK/SpoIIIE
MARIDSARRGGGFRAELSAMVARSGLMASGAALILLGVALGVALATYHQTDPSLNTASGADAANWMGGIGAWVADILLQMLGIGAALLVPLPIALGVQLAQGRPLARLKLRVMATLVGAAAIAFALGVCLSTGGDLLPAGWGGIVGWTGGNGAVALGALAGAEGGLWVRAGLATVLIAVGITLWAWSLGFEKEEWRALFAALRSPPRDEAVAPEPLPAAAAVPAPPHRTPAAEPPQHRVVERTVAPAISKRSQRERQSALDLGDNYNLPPLDLLAPAPARRLEQNARLLESVLEDFGVRGEIVEVRPGPVVTMYELEPAAGIKASRVIGLADDIARSMSAISARVAVVPGRNVIGIELPNRNRESVSLSELIGSDEFEERTRALPIVLGKNIAGEPVISDLAPMPHLLIAGTTGSGKSVGLNCMILSLLYRLSPDQCRMIMIDPKMLELSIYDGIPHLLSPVVTEPQKAIRALKWAVEQMEERYRMMASVGVRALSSFNAKVREAKAKGQTLGRRVQTGWDAGSGQPIYEEEMHDYEPLPLIVVVVDELADLMMTAGKEVEFLIQRLAQKARAAGIHLIMATQRPSVDVITGVIKANLPTRISFQVTSKIDSRTIIGEQGAEQLLGKGDMLFMPNGKQIARVHGPFVSDEEVQAVADHWRGEGSPEYISSVTEEPEDQGAFGFGDNIEEDDSETALYRRGVQIVAESRKASTSYIQRQLRIGYNNAARLIERMEKEGIVSSADHVGRREVLIDPEGHPL